MSAPAVTVITIFKDVAPFLREAVESVVAQTHEDWELLLVDDGSTDGSRELAHELQREHGSRLRCLAHPDGGNHGMSASRNLGLAHACGRAVAFLDGDDVYLPHKLELQLGVLDAHPSAGMVHGPMTLWWSWTGDPQDAGRDRTRPLRLPVGVVLPPPVLLRAYVRGRAGTPATCSVLLRSRVAAQVGGFEPRFAGLYEDQVFFHKVAAHVPVVLTDVAADLYRQHGGSATARALDTGQWRREGGSPANEAFQRWLDGYLAEHRPRDLPTRARVRWHLLGNRVPALPRAARAARRVVSR